MSFAQGVDFRTTAAFVTDPTNYDHCQGGAPTSMQYPTVMSPSGVNGGWETTDNDSRDRVAYTGAAASLAGMISPGNGSPATITFRIDLPATGKYDIFCGCGDANYSASGITTKFKDTNTVLATPMSAAATSAADHFFDATGVERTSHSDWVTNSAPSTQTFSTTIFRVDQIGNICNIFIQASAGGVAATTSYLPLMGCG